MVAQVRYSMVGRSRGRVASCAVRIMHVETRSTSFLVESQNQGRRCVSGLASKPLRQFLAVWSQNLLRRFSLVWPGLKTSGDGFLLFGLKTGGDGFSRFDLKTGGGFLG
jgi:hypothetical protein